MRAASFVVGLCLVVAACGGDDSQSTECDFPLTVEEGTTPTYVFEGNVARVSVIRDEDPNTIVWGVFANPPGDNIASPVQHGTVPANASLQTQEEITLSVGIAYTVIVAKENGVTCEAMFTP